MSNRVPVDFELLEQLVNIPSPPGHEGRLQARLLEWAKPFCDEITQDSHGNLIAIRRADRSRVGMNGKPVQRILLAGHCDQLSLMVVHVDDSGFLLVQPVGGWDLAILLGQSLTLWTESGPIPAVCSRKAPHLMTPEERNKLPVWHELWVDAGFKDKKDAESLVQVGDFITAELSLTVMRGEFLSGPGLDDKTGVWTVFETLRLLAGKPLAVDLYCVSTVQEEIGLRGAMTSAYGIDPTVGIAVDVTHATDTPGTEKKQVGDVRLGQGTVIHRGPNIHPLVSRLMIESAKAESIPFQVRAVPKGTGTDANAIQTTRGGVATGLIGIPNRYMHSPVEMVHMEDLRQGARLLARLVQNLDGSTDWAGFWSGSPAAAI
jgi:putative aminopeptidase FrvX